MPRVRLMMIFLLVGTCAFAADPDSLVLWNELEFATTFEKESFDTFLKKKDNDFLRVFLANDPDGADDLPKFQHKTQQTLDEIRASGNLAKKNAKKIKYIYDLVHKKFFTQYETENRFYEIIQTGKYNCVTATALYAWFFEQLGIPYTIKEEPTHVYLVAYPNTDNIMVESTTPMVGFYAFNPEFKATYVSRLKEQKIIGPEESASTTDALFNKYYFGTENISLTQLVGIHYMNDGLYRRETKDYSGAYEQFKKAHFYYPGTRCEFLLMSMLSARIDDDKLDPVKRSMLIGAASRMGKSGITPAMIEGEFQKLTQEVLIRNNDRATYRKCYDEIIRSVRDKELLNDIAYTYYYENGRILYNTGNQVKARPYLVAALRQQPNNADLGAIVVASLAQSFRNTPNTRTIIDSLEYYRATFPILNENNNFNSILAMSYAVAFGDAYDTGNATEGDKYQKLFEDLYRSDKNISIMSPDAIGRAYSNACTHYFRKGQKSKAKQYLEWGLAIVPNDYQLKVRRQMISQ